MRSGTVQAGGGALVLAIMWIPGVSALFTLLVTRQPLGTIAWRLRRPIDLVYAYCIPLLYVSVAYVPLWLLGHFASGKRLTLQSIGLPLLGAFVNVLATLGEEIGWRGFLFPQLERKTTFTKAALLTGLVWSVWHIPGLLMTDYGSGAPWYTAVPFFIVTLTAISLPMAYLCKRADSVWPAVLFHGAHNAFIQAFFDPFTARDDFARTWSGETGLALAITSSLLLLVFLRKSSSGLADSSPALRRAPSVLPTGTGSL